MADVPVTVGDATGYGDAEANGIGEFVGEFTVLHQKCMTRASGIPVDDLLLRGRSGLPDSETAPEGPFASNAW